MCHSTYVFINSTMYENYEITIRTSNTLVQALRLCTGRTAHKGSRGIALLFHDHDTRRC